MEQCVGSKVRITADDGIYIGVVDSIELHQGRVTLKNVTSGESNEPLGGKFHFFRTEIEKIDILENPSTKPGHLSHINPGGPKLVSKRIQPEHLRHMKDLDHSNMLLSGDSSKPIKNSQFSSSGKVSNGPFKQQKSGADKTESTDIGRTQTTSLQNGVTEGSSQHLLNDFTLIDELGSVFQEALGHVMDQQVVGMTMEGVNLGRNGTLCWLTISTRSHLILFDMIKLGDEAFTQGLGQLLQHENILKVVHDCRRISDMLYHQHSIKLVNIFDTQVADVMIYQLEHHGRFPEYVNSLSVCLFEHMELTEDEVYIPHMRASSMARDQAVWQKRPAPGDVLNALVKSTRCLLELRRILLVKMMQNFTDGVDIYLGALRDAASPQTSNKDGHLLPRTFQDLRVQAARSRQLANVHGGGEQFVQNCVGVYNPRVKFNHDSPWRVGDGKMVRTSRTVDRERIARAEQRRSATRSKSRSSSRSRSESDASKEPKLLPRRDPPTSAFTSPTQPSITVKLNDDEVITVKLPHSDSDGEGLVHCGESGHSRPSSNSSDFNQKRPKSPVDSRIIFKAAGNENLVAAPKEKDRRKNNLSCPEREGSKWASSKRVDHKQHGDLTSNSTLPRSISSPSKLQEETGDVSDARPRSVTASQSTGSPSPDNMAAARAIGRAKLLQTMLTSPTSPACSETNSLLSRVNDRILLSEAEGQFNDASEQGERAMSSCESGVKTFGRTRPTPSESRMPRPKRAGLGRAASLAQYD